MVINGENVVSGCGIIEKIYKDFLEFGVNVVIFGNYIWDNCDIFEFIDDVKYLVCLVNFLDDIIFGMGMVFVKSN